jgi:hypothetical protein
MDFGVILWGLLEFRSVVPTTTILPPFLTNYIATKTSRGKLRLTTAAAITWSCFTGGLERATRLNWRGYHEALRGCSGQSPTLVGKGQRPNASDYLAPTTTLKVASQPFEALSRRQLGILTERFNT